MVRGCWCADCQKISSGSASINAFYARPDLEVFGETARYQRGADSGAKICHEFCAHCATQLFASDAETPTHVAVRVGAFDEPRDLQPSIYIWTGSAPSWAVLDPACELHVGQP